MANSYDIIIRPIITERSMAAVAEKKYVFEVAKTAGKVEIKDAIEKIFDVKVAKATSRLILIYRYPVHRQPPFEVTHRQHLSKPDR